jgi:hypothetical protein
MPEENEQEHKPANRAGVIITIVVLAVALVPAVYLILRNVGKINTGPVPVAIRPVAPDTGLHRFRSSYRIRLRRLDERFKRHILKGGMLTAQQESLAVACSTSLAFSHAFLASMDTIKGDRQMKVVAEGVKESYNAAKAAAWAFTRSLNKPELEMDSLDEQFREVLSE